MRGHIFSHGRVPSHRNYSCLIKVQSTETTLQNATLKTKKEEATTLNFRRELYRVHTGNYSSRITGFDTPTESLQPERLVRTYLYFFLVLYDKNRQPS